MYKLLPCLGFFAPILFGSCSMDAVKSSAADATRGMQHFSFSDLKPAKVDVVQVREKELKEMPLGKDRALAFEQQQARQQEQQQQQQKERTFWSFAKPVKFEEPSLPKVNKDGVDGLLLPPKSL